jgi:hypothetical protein
LSVEPRYKPSPLAAAVSSHYDTGAGGGGAKQVLAVRRGQCLCDVRMSHRDHLQAVRLRPLACLHEWRY